MDEQERRRRMKLRFEPLPHPAFVCSGSQLDGVIEEMEAGTMPGPDEGAVWRPELDVTTCERLARATGASDEMIAAQWATSPG
jgi:hypothetical protein